MSTAYEPAPIPPDEAQRLAALRDSGLLDSQAQGGVHRITRSAARLLGTPIALVSLVDERRQWFLSRVGLEAPQTPRDVSFCGHVVALHEPLVVVDSWQDPRFAGNPLVCGEPGVRAYLGVPLHAGGTQPIGTLCVIDTQPRQFSDADLQVLTRCARALELLLGL